LRIEDLPALVIEMDALLTKFNIPYITKNLEENNAYLKMPYIRFTKTKKLPA
jgi:hypothetical protein